MYKRIKSEKGFTLVDITVAIIVILLFMSLIAVLFFFFFKSSKSIDRKSEAIYLATEIIEGFSAQNYDDVKITGTSSQENWIEITNPNDSNDLYGMVNGEATEFVKNVKIKEGYSCSVSIYNYIPEENTHESDLVKVIKVRVTYKVANERKNVELTTSIVRND